MPDIHFECPKCNQKIDAPAEFGCQMIECPTCREAIEIPPRPIEAQASPKAAARVAVPPALPLPSAPFTPPKFSGITSSQGSVIIVLLILGLFVFPFIHFMNDSTSLPQWEYDVVSVPDSLFENKMNALGREGWELVFARRASSGGDLTTFSYEMILKRPRKL